MNASQVPKRLRLAAILRRGWLVVLTAAAVAGLAYAIAQARSRSYTAEAVTVVRSGATAKGPGQANDAMTLAATYAGVIPQDTRVSRYVAAGLRGRASAVEDRISVVNDSGTSILRLRYRDSSANRATDGARRLVGAVAGLRPVTPAVTRNAIQLVRLPSRVKASTDVTGTAVPLGLLLGLGLGLLLLIAWERADPRLDDATDLAAETTAPVSDLRGLSPSATLAVLDRWAALSERSPARVALLPVTGKARTLAEDAAQRLHEVHDRAGREADRGGPVPAPLELEVGGVPGTEAAGEALAVASDLTVLVVPRGGSVRDVRAAEGALRQFGVRPGWALLGRRRRFGRGTGGDAPPPRSVTPDASDERTMSDPEPASVGAVAARTSVDAQERSMSDTRVSRRTRAAESGSSSAVPGGPDGSPDPSPSA